MFLRKITFLQLRIYFSSISIFLIKEINLRKRKTLPKFVEHVRRKHKKPVFQTFLTVKTRTPTMLLLYCLLKL